MRSLDSGFQSIAPRLFLILITLGALSGTMLIGATIGQGEFVLVYMFLVGVAGLIAVLKSGSRYWLLIPFSLSFTAPVIPLGGRAVELPELAIAVCAVLFLIRVALKGQKLRVLRPEHVPFLLYAAWAGLIYLHNPIGLSAFGSSSGGGRFYLKIFLALVAFLIVANQRITNRDCKWILIATVIGVTLDFGKTLFFYWVLGIQIGGFEDPLSYYTWQQELSAVPIVLVLILFARYSTAEILDLRKLWRLLLLLLCVPLILLSGKRSAAMSLVLFPVVAAFCRREFRYLFLWITCALVAGIILVAGQGTLFNLPLTAQRALSWLPGQWDSELAYMEGGKDVFRTKLRKMAEEKIHKNPWIGRGYDVDVSGGDRLSMTMANKFDANVTQMGIGSQWHNRWLGYAADFGIPASILLAVIYLFVILHCWQIFPRLPPGSLLQTMVMFVLLSTVIDAAFSHVSGHSANDAFTRWWMYGVVVSIAASLNKDRSSLPVGDPQTLQRNPRPEPVAAR